VRAATCFDEASTINSRAHNDANVMCLGSKVLKPDAALRLARIFLDHAFEGGRHARRVDKITAIERAFTRAPEEALGAGGSRRP
jgi:ribose 5-phosphate isomerase B